MSKRRVIIGIKNSRDFDLLTLGQLLLKLLPPDNERLSGGDTSMRQVSGTGLNVAVGAALLGLHTGIISKLPAHNIGSFMKDKIYSFGVSDDFFMYDQSSSARVDIYYYENGAYPRKSKITYDRNSSSSFSLNVDEIPREVYTTSKCSHTTGITLTLNEKIYKATIRMIKRFKAAGTLVSLSVDFRDNLWTGDEARECILYILPCVSIFFCSEDTARLTFPKTGTAKRMMKSFSQEFLVSIVASTQRIIHSPKRHTFGSVIYDAARDEYYEEKFYRDIKVVDRIGSGDAYTSGAPYRLLSSGGDCFKAIAYGNATAAVKDTIPGNPSSSNLGEIETIIRTHNQTGPRFGAAR